jgi:uncharacterized protein (TIGR03382 family)
MCSAVAAVAVAGSASAAVVSLWDFSDFTIGTAPTGTSSSGATNGGNSGTVAGNPLPNWSTTLLRTQTSMTGSGGKVNVTLGGSFSAKAEFTLQGGLVNLTGTTSFDVNITDFSGQSTQTGLEIYDANGKGAFMDSTILVGSVGNVSISTSSNWITEAGFDWSRVGYINLYFTRNTTSVDANSIASSFSFDSFNAVGVIPAPGAVALLGAAGVVGMRRRRN